MRRESETQHCRPSAAAYALTISTDEEFSRRTLELCDAGPSGFSMKQERNPGVRCSDLVRRRGHLLSCFEQHFSPISQSIGPTKNAMPTKHNPATTASISPGSTLISNAPGRRKNVNDNIAPIRANVFIHVFDDYASLCVAK